MDVFHEGYKHRSCLGVDPREKAINIAPLLRQPELNIFKNPSCYTFHIANLEQRKEFSSIREIIETDLNANLPNFKERAHCKSSFVFILHSWSTDFKI